MVVFALRVHHFAERAGGVKLTSGVNIVVKRARLEHTVLFAGFLDRFVKKLGLLRLAAPKRRNRARDVFSRVHRRDAVRDVVRRVGRDENRLDRVVLRDHLFERIVSFFTAASLRQTVATLRYQVGYGDDLDVRVILESERRPKLTRAEPGDPNANLAVANRLPNERFVDVGLRLVEPLDFRRIVRPSGGPESAA